MGTRCSGRSAKATGGRATSGNRATPKLGAGRACTAAGSSGGADCTAAAALSTSPLVMRPSRPVPATEPAASCLSAINLAAAGMATPAIGAAGGAALSAAVAPAAAPTAWPCVSIRAINCSAITVAPSLTNNSHNTPALGAGTSKTTLSVSISVKISSTNTDSPTFFFHCNRVASATDSESCGTLTSTIAMEMLSVFIQKRAGARAYLLKMKPLSLPKAPSTKAFCCSWCRWE